MKIVTKVVNSIRGGIRSHRKFKTFLENVDAAYNDLLLHSQVRWLSAGKTLERFFALRKEIPQFLKKETKVETDVLEKFRDVKFLCELPFSTDITDHLNSLNITLQTQDRTMSDLVAQLKGFKNQIQLFIAELKLSELYHFSARKEIAEEHEGPNFTELLPISIEIEKECNNRFADFDTLKQDLLIFNNTKVFRIRTEK